jgi:alpha-L-fucosidase
MAGKKMDGRIFQGLEQLRFINRRTEMRLLRIMAIAFFAANAVLASAGRIPLETRIETAVQKAQQVAEQGPFQPNWKSLENYEIPQWYKDAKFGIFIHWGVYCVPAFMNEWYPRMMYIDEKTWRGNAYRHHLETYGPQSKFGYKDFIPMLKAEKFNAAEWAALFKEAGARYVVPVAEHHDGFPMYDCSYTKWNAAKMGPKRDVIGELEKAVRAEGMHFGVSSHRAFNWAFYGRRPEYDTVNPENFGLYGRDIPYLYTAGFADYKKNHWPPHDKQFKDDWLARTCEMVDKYNPDLVWFDFGIAPSWVDSYETNPYAGHLKLFAAYYYNHAAQRKGSAIINYKFNAFPEKAAVYDLERSKMDAIRRPFWQTDTAVSENSWGYITNHKYKPVNRLIDDLVDIVSKNGCLLLNIGPRADGTIPEHEQEMLREIGSWLKINGEAIYSTEPWKIYGEGPTGTATGHLSEDKNEPFTARDIRFTTKGDTLYATLLDWPGDGAVTINALTSGALKIGKVELLGSGAAVKWSQDATGLKIQLPADKPCDHAFVLKINP